MAVSRPSDINSGRISFAKIREPLEVPNLLALQIESFEWLMGSDEWQARVKEAAAAGREIGRAHV